MRCYICDFSEFTKSLYHEGLVVETKGVKLLRTTKPNEFICSSCLFIPISIYKSMDNEKDFVDPAFDVD